jgi:VanZ family protein
LKVARIAAWSLATLIVALSVVPPGLRPETPAPHDLEHFMIFWATGAMFRLGYSLQSGLLAILFVIFAGCVEIIQLFAPGRHARLSDFLVDALAMFIGLISASLVSQIRSRI